MPQEPIVDFKTNFVGVEQAYAKVKNIIASKPIGVKFVSDTKGLKDLSNGLGKLSGSADEFTKSLEAANARVLAFGASVAVISAIQRGFVNLVKSTIEVEAAFKKISVVGDQFASTAGQLEKFGRGIFDVARQTGQSFDETSKAALEFARQGLGAAETLTRVKDALTLTRLSGLDATSSVEGLTAAVNSFKKEGLSTTDVLNKLIAVDNKYAVSSGDLIEAIKRSGSFAQEAGVGFDELTATVTVLQEATARGGSVIGNSLKTIFERVGRPESIKQLRALKVEVEDAGGKILPAIKIVDNFANKLGEMDETAKRTALRQLAGTLQINQLSALTNALKEAEGASRRYDEVLSTSANASIEASTANDKLNQTLDSQIKALLATGTQLGSLFGDIAIAPALQNIISGPYGIAELGKTIIEGLSSDGPSITKAFTGVIGDAILAAGLAGTLSIGLILKKFALFAKDSFSNILGLNSASKNQEAIQLTILNTLRGRSDIEAAILSAGSSQVAQATVLAKLYNEMANDNARQLATSKALAGVLAPSFVASGGGVLTPRNRKQGFNAASGYVPDLIQAEYADIKKGVGGADKNAGVVLIKDFPFGGGKKGPMVANTSEAIAPMGNGAAVLNRDMLDKMGYGKRAAQGDVPYLSPQENAIRAELQQKRLASQQQAELVKKLQQEALEAQKASAEADKAASKAAEKAAKERQKSEQAAARAAEKQAKAAIKEREKLANQEIAEARKRQKALDNANKERARADKIAQEAARKSADAEQKAAKAKEEEFRKSFPATAQLKRDQQLRASGQLLSPVSGGFGAFGRSTQEDIKRQNRQQILSRAGNVLAAGSFDSNIGFSSKNREQAMDAAEFFLDQKTPRDLKTGNIGYKKTFGGNPSFRKDAVSQVGSAFSQFSKEQAQSAKNARGGEYEIYNRLEKLRVEDLKKEIKSRLANGAGPGDKLRATDGLASELKDLSSQVSATKKTFNEAAIEFGTQFGSIFLGASVAKEALTLFGLEMDKTVDTIRDVAIAYVGIQKLGQLGGVNAGSISGLLKGRGGNFGKAFSAGRQGLGSSAVGLLAGNSRVAKIGTTLGSVVGGLTKFGAGLLRFLPVIGQITVGLFAVNSVLKAFGVDVYSSIREFVTGLSTEGREARDSLKAFSESLFESGQFVGRTREDASRSLLTKIQEQKELTRAKKFGVDTKGKDAKQIASENFVKELKSILASESTGKQTGEMIAGGQISPGVFIDPVFADQQFSDLNESVQNIIAESIGEIFALNLQELESLAKKKGIKTTGRETREELRNTLSKEAFRSGVRSKVIDFIGKDVPNANYNGTSAFQSVTESFLNPKGAARKELQARQPELFTDVNTVKAQVSAALELKKLQLDFSTEAERVLETKIKTAQISEIERTNLQTVLDGLKLERALRGDIFDIASKGIDKLTSAEGFGDLEKTNLKASIKAISELGLGADETKRKISEILDVLGGDVSTENIKKEILGQLDGLKKSSDERRNQLKIQSEQLKNEARITESLRLQQSLLSSNSDIRNARIGVQKTSLESRISGLDAQSNSPNLSIQQQNALRKDGNALRLQSFDLDKRLAESEKKTAEDNLRLNKVLSDPEKANEQKKIDLNFQRTTESINSQIEALKIQGSQIEQSASAMTLLANAAYQFKQNLGELEASNTLSSLRATDISSLGSSLASQQAFGDLGSSGKSGLDAEQFLTDRTALRQKEFEIVSATTNAQKIQLSQEKKALEDIISIKERGGSVDEQIAALIDAQNKRLKEQRSLRSGVNNATAQMRDEINTFGSDFGETATFGFKDALSDALKAAASGTGNLKNALLDVALSFANKLRDAALDNLAKIATNALFGGGNSSGGGNIVSGVLSGIGSLFGAKGYASGGKITGGSGVKDDVPILGMGGEFMINKKSVQKYGPQLFEALNQGRLQKMASGGLVDPGMSGKSIRGSKNLLDFASQNFTSGAGDKIMNLGGGAASVELDPESLRLTNFARQSGNPLQSATQDAKEQALALVFQDQSLQKQYREQIDAIKKAEKEKQKQLLISLAVTAVSSGLGAAFSGGGASQLGSTGITGGRNISDRPQGLSGYSTGSSSGLSNRSIIRSTSSASNFSAGTTRAFSSGSLGLPSGGGADFYNPLLPSIGRASGGAVNGNGYGDNVPAMLSGGEFVMNRKAAKNLGLANLNAANAGQSVGMSDEKSEELNNRLIDKLDELVEKMSSNNNVTVNVSMDKDGKSNSSESGAQNEDQKNMNRRIKDAVVQILQDEKRLGGVLRK